MADISAERSALADYLAGRLSAIVDAWRAAVKRDPALMTGESLPRSQLLDHIPAILATFQNELRHAPADDVSSAISAAQQPAAAHGLQRWQQGYGLREVTRELGKLNECVVAELDAYTRSHPHISHEGVAVARRIWAALCSTGIEESVGQYFQLQQKEAAGHVADLESALEEIRHLEQQRADLWRQAAHDLRGNLGVVANATVGLAHGGLHDATRDDFVRILMRNVTTLHHLLDDVTSLARLQAGKEQRQIEPIDVSPIMQQLCEGIRPLAQQRRLFLRCDGPPGFAADGDAVKIRRIAQNLILNAVKFTRDGGITVSWGDSSPDDAKRWMLCVADSGPGFHSSSAEPLAQVMGQPPEHAAVAAAPVVAVAGAPAVAVVPAVAVAPPVAIAPARAADTAIGEDAGEGIGLSIVKRLCDLLDATVEMTSRKGVGTTFRILFPRTYAN